jgi:SRSO17 transposase
MVEARMAVAVEVQGRLAAFVEDVVAGLRHVRQRENAALYVRGLLEEGPRKSLQPTLFRLGASARRYESLQLFVADSPWPAEELVRACAERVTPHLGVVAWVIDDTGFPKCGRRSPGVKRQYSGTLGKIGNCQIGVSLHAVGERGTLPLGWALYLPEEWCSDVERRRRAKIPDGVEFAAKPRLAVGLIEQAVGWQVPRAPVLADQAYGDDSGLRTALDDARLDYVVAVKADTAVYGPETSFSVPQRAGPLGRRPHVAKPDRHRESLRALAQRLPDEAWAQLPYRSSAAGEPINGRFACVRVCAAHPIHVGRRVPRWEWLIVEWPDGDETPSDYWLSNLPHGTRPEELARLARLRWTIELDYRQLKGELGLDHYEGRSWAGWHHHCALVTCAHAFLSEERLRPSPARPA